jgi:NADH dehydrogenase FAD-containing subunit
MGKNVVIVGGGPSAKHAAESLLKKGKDLQVTIVQANRFVEWPIPMTTCLVKPELHDKALATDCAKFQVPKVAYTYGVVQGVDTKAKELRLAGGETVPYDALIVATGFGVPLVYPSLGVSLEDRKAEVQRVGDAIKQSKCVVVAGAGPIGLELAGDIRVEYPDKKVVLLSRGRVLGQWPETKRYKVEAQLRKMEIDVVGVSAGAPTEPSLQPGTVKTDDGDLAYDVYLPAFSLGPNTKFLEGGGGVTGSGLTEPGTGRVDVNEFLQSRACPEIFAVGVSNAPAPFVGLAKLQTQWEDAAANVVALLSGKPLKKHKEGAAFMKLPPLVLVGHGPRGYGWLDFGNLPPPCKLCCCCGFAGFPCCPPCWPCCACGGCGACPFGYCCMPPEGTGPSKLGAKVSFMSSGFHFKGVGEAPKQQVMK